MSKPELTSKTAPVLGKRKVQLEEALGDVMRPLLIQFEEETGLRINEVIMAPIDVSTNSERAFLWGAAQVRVKVLDDYLYEYYSA